MTTALKNVSDKPIVEDTLRGKEYKFLPGEFLPVDKEDLDKGIQIKAALAKKRLVPLEDSVLKDDKIEESIPKPTTSGKPKKKKAKKKTTKRSGGNP